MLYKILKRKDMHKTKEIKALSLDSVIRLHQNKTENFILKYAQIFQICQRFWKLFLSGSLNEL